MRKLALVAVLALVAACGGTNESDVDWTKYPPGYRQAVHQAVEDRDCGRMGNQFIAAKGKHDGDLMAYVDHAMREADCPWRAVRGEGGTGELREPPPRRSCQDSSSCGPR